MSADTMDLADRLSRLKYKVAVIGSVIKDREIDRNEREGACSLCLEIQDELDAIGEAIHPEEAAS